MLLPTLTVNGAQVSVRRSQPHPHEASSRTVAAWCGRLPCKTVYLRLWPKVLSLALWFAVRARNVGYHAALQLAVESLLPSLGALWWSCHQRRYVAHYCWDQKHAVGVRRSTRGSIGMLFLGFAGSSQGVHRINMDNTACLMLGLHQAGILVQARRGVLGRAHKY